MTLHHTVGTQGHLVEETWHTVGTRGYLIEESTRNTMGAGGHQVEEVLAHSRNFYPGQASPWSLFEGTQRPQSLTSLCTPLAPEPQCLGLSLVTSARIWVSSGDPGKRVPQNWEAVFLSVFTSG